MAHPLLGPTLPGAELSVAEHHRKAGYLHLIVGPMFAGKTTTLLNELLAEEVRDPEVAAATVPART